MRAAATAAANVTRSGEDCSPSWSTTLFCMSITSNASLVIGTCRHRFVVIGAVFPTGHVASVEANEAARSVRRLPGGPHQEEDHIAWRPASVLTRRNPARMRVRCEAMFSKSCRRSP